MTNVPSKDTNEPLSQRQLDFRISDGMGRGSTSAQLETGRRQAVVPYIGNSRKAFETIR
jgi:hypothetical protein